MTPDQRRVKPPLLSIAMISLLALSYEILLMRLFSIIQWHHFAYMIISIALLGYGASGAFLMLIRNQLAKHFRLLFYGNILLFSLSSILCFVVSQAISFHPLELLWDLRQWLSLSAIYLLLIVPFFSAANAIGLVLNIYSEKINLVYSADLLGAALGSLFIIVLLFWLFPQQILITIFALSLATVGLAIIEIDKHYGWCFSFISIALLVWLLPQQGLQIKPSEYKQLNQTLNVIGATRISQTTGPLGVLTVVENETIPFRHAPGLSLNNTQEPPPQKAIFTDGDGMTMITAFNGQTEPLTYMSQMTSTLPYVLLKQPKVFIIGAGGGSDILQALYFEASSIDAVELNRQIVDLVKTEYANFSGNLYNQKNIHIHIQDARAFLNTHNESFDLIQLSLIDSFGAASAGLYSLNENYLYTIEAIQHYWQHLTPNGVLAFTRWLKLPPRDALKLVATVVAALKQQGVAQPTQHLAMIRSWNTTTLVLTKQAMTHEHIASIKHFAEQQSFDLVYYPGITPTETNQFNRLAQPFFFTGISALLSEQSQDYEKSYKYHLTPATDDQPYFSHFMKWSSLPEILNLPAKQGLSLIEWGSLILAITLLQACIASLLLIVLPLCLHYRKQAIKPIKHRDQWFVFAYFFSIGIAFMFIEIAFIQKFILFLSDPIYTVALVLFAFFLFAGLGSRFSSYFQPRLTIFMAVTGIIITTSGYLFFLPELFAWLISTHESIKILVTLLLIAPLALLMGMPFPIGLNHTATTVPSFIPWAWGVNGCASVISAILATYIAIQGGFTLVIIIAVFAYIFAASLFLWRIQAMH